jgi:hypothetical protein
MRKNHENASIHRSQGRHRAWSALISLSLAAAMGVSAVGCSGQGVSEEAASNDAAARRERALEPEPNDAVSEDALIKSHLQARGYDTSTLQFQGDTVIVEDDMAMSRAVLLDEAEAAATGVVEKGYFHTTGLFSGDRIQLSFGAGVSSAWRAALNAAQTEWNRRTPRFVRDPGGAGTITVQAQAMTDAMGNPNTGTIANGTIPPSRTITLNTNYSGTCASTLEGIAADTKAYAALHEMGHVLGFAHPPPNTTNNPRVHIDGTAVSDGFIDPSYATIMAVQCGTSTTLFADDVLSAQKKYPSCMDTCETNCTFNVDHEQIGLCIASCPSQCGG